MLKEQYDTTLPKMSNYMFDGNQSLRINFEKLVGTVHVVFRGKLTVEKKAKYLKR